MQSKDACASLFDLIVIENGVVNFVRLSIKLKGSVFLEERI
jgi:hypothetical protein